MAYNDAIDSSGISALVPEDVARDVISGIRVKSAAMQMMRPARMTTSQNRLPVLAALPSAGFVASGGGLKKTTKAAWANKYLIAEEIASIVPIPESYLDDSSFDVWAEVKPLMEEAMAITLDGAVFFGIDKPDTWGMDIYSHAVAAGNGVVRGAIASQDVAGDISDVMGLVENDGYDVNGHVARKTLKAVLRNLRDDNGSPIFSPGLTAGTPGTLWGEPIRYASNGAFDTANALLLTGDFNQAILATRQDITYKVLDQATLTDDEGNVMFNLAQQDMVALRVVARYAYQVVNVINREGDYDGQSPFGVLHPTGWTP
jgi:HK97 family phage major capsid protein